MKYRTPLCTKNGVPIRILQVGHHFCIRNIKICRALKKKGYHLDCLTNRISYGTDEYERVFFYHNKTQFRNVLRDIKNWYDIIECANEPDWMIVEAKALGCRKVIHDCHDLDSIRLGLANLDEIRAFNVADGVLFVSQPVRDFAVSLHKYERPTAVLQHYCNEEFLDLYTPGQDIGRKGIVYEGGATPPDSDSPFKYRYLYHLMKAIVDMGNELYMYIGNPDGYQTYQDIGAVVYPPTHYDEMMKGMTRFKWGACIFNNEDLTDAQTNMTLMNKAYEYIMCGLPVIFVGAPHQAELFRPYNISIEFHKITDIGNIEAKYGDLYPTLKSNVDKARKVLTMERNIYKLERLYKQVLK